MTKQSSSPWNSVDARDDQRLATELNQIRAVADNMPQLAWSCLPDGYCDYLSRQWVEYTGAPEKAHHGRGWLEAVHPDDRDRTRIGWDAFVSGLAEYDVDYRLRRHDGVYRWFKARGILVRDEAGVPFRVFGTTADIDDQKRTEERIRELDERAAFVRKASGVGFWYCDLPFDTLEWDELVKQHFHLAPDAPVTIDTFYERLHPDDRVRTRDAIERSIAERAVYDVHYRTVSPETGEIKWIRAIGRSYYDADGNPRRFDGVTLDVTEQRRIDERQRFLADLAAATQPLSDADEVTALTARKLADHLGADRCAYAAVEDGAVYVISGDYTRGVPSIVGRWPVAAFGAEHLRAMRAGEAYVVDDADVDSRITPHDLPAFRATSIRSVICVPLHKDSKFTAAMAVHQATPRHWRADEVELVQTVVAQCWEALERTRATALLRASEERFRVFMDNSPAAAWITDGEGRVRYVSAAYRRLFKISTQDVVGASPTELFPEQFAAEYIRNIRRVIESGQPLETIETAPRPDGSIGEFLVYKFPLPGGSWVGGVAVDISERRRAEEQLRDADRRKDEFLALLAHELRNPLAPLRNGLQVMRLTGGAGDAAERARAMMDRQLGHMVRLIDDLLDVSRISRNKMELRRERVLLSDAVANAVETARPAIDAADHQLIVSLPPQPVYLEADLTRLAQVFSNLLTNAAKYTESGGRIWLTASLGADEVSIAVRDTGIGIPPESLAAIFDMFSQVDRSIERATGGLGIGLALVKGLVEMHGGRVTADSVGPGHGSTFTITLPRERDLTHATEANVPRSIPTPTMPARRILVVDDNRDSAASMAVMLELLGHEVRTAHDGIEAIAVAEAFRPELILMDVGMPRMNGYDATRQLRQRAWGKEIAIVAVTGWGQEGDRAQSRDAGCDGHLVKPVALDDLLPFLVAQTKS
jgi:PAS domain S-box-containing protein